MALNRYMHPRNHYKDNKPNFQELALKYPEFAKQATQDLSGKISLNFKSPDSVRVLTQTLLKEDFNLIVELPDDRLTPTLPSRLNYIHWIEDIFSQSSRTYKNLRGIDIGTGASCIYPLLGCKLNDWMFVATEIDDKNVEYAKTNVNCNNMDGKIEVLKVAKGTGIPDVILSKSESKFDFIMCNPPFFADHMEAQAITTSRTATRPDPPSISTAEDCESVIHGGEVAFIKQMIQDSFKLKERIRVFTSMVGKKINVSLIKEELKRCQIAMFSTTEFCQGKTMRWGIVWTFDSSIKFPKSYFEKKKKKKNCPLVFEIPFDNGLVLYDIQNMTAYMTSQLKELKIQYKEGKRTDIKSTITMTAKENTWSHQRRKRRLEKREIIFDDSDKSYVPVTEVQINDEKTSTDTEIVNKSKITTEVQPLKNGGFTNSSEEMSERKKVKVDVKSNEEIIDNDKEKTNTKIILSKSKEVTASSDKKDSSHSVKCLVRCRMILKKNGNTITLEMIDLDGTNRELTNQILQHFKNKLKSKT